MPRKIEKRWPRKTGVPGISQIGPGRFLVVARWTDPRTGRRKKREVEAPTLAEAVAAQERLRADRPSLKPARQRVEGYAAHWWTVHRGDYADSTRDRYEEAIAAVVAELGEVYIDALHVQDVREWHRRLRDRHKMAKATANGMLRVARVLFDDAVADGMLRANPARMVAELKVGRTKGRRGRSLRREQFVAFLGAARDLVADGKITEDVGRMIAVLAWGGMRRGELLALHWEDHVDGELLVTRSVYDHVEKCNKTDDPRIVIVVPPLAEVLETQRRWLLETQHPGLASGLVFPASPSHARTGARRRNAPITWHRTKSILQKPLLAVCDRADVPELSPQALRRTLEDLARQAGVEELVRKANAGWRTSAAQAIYATVTKEERDAAGAKLLAYVAPH